MDEPAASTEALIAPPDRSHIETERRNARTMDLGSLGVEACLRRINAEDHNVAAAVKGAEADGLQVVPAATLGHKCDLALMALGAMQPRPEPPPPPPGGMAPYGGGFGGPQAPYGGGFGGQR